MASEEYMELSAKLDKLIQMSEAQKEVLNIEECARMTGNTVSYIYKLTAQRKIPFYKPQGKRIFFKRTEIENWLLQYRQPTTEEVEREAETYCATH